MTLSLITTVAATLAALGLGTTLAAIFVRE
jgi:hypothetical protein